MADIIKNHVDMDTLWKDMGDTTHAQVIYIGGGTGLTVTADPASVTLTHISGTVAAAGTATLVAAPGADYRIVVTSFVIQNESATATTMILENGITDNWRVLGQNQGDGLSKDFAVGREWRLAENVALGLNLSGNNQCGYSVAYYTEAC